MLGHHVMTNVNAVLQRAEHYRRIGTERVYDRGEGSGVGCSDVDRGAAGHSTGRIVGERDAIGAQRNSSRKQCSRSICSFGCIRQLGHGDPFGSMIARLENDGSQC